MLNRRKTDKIGAVGEKRVGHILKEVPESILLTNLLIPQPGGTSEIDAVLITPKLILVFEIKNYSAASSVTGSLTRYEWTQTFNQKGKKPIKRKVFNPVRQNETHITTIVRFLQRKGIRIQESHCHSVIVFNSQCTLKKVPSGKDFTVTQEHVLRSSLNRRLRARKDLFTKTEMKAIEKALEETSGATARQKERHVAYAKQAELKRRAEQEKRRKAKKRRLIKHASV